MNDKRSSRTPNLMGIRVGTMEVVAGPFYVKNSNGRNKAWWEVRCACGVVKKVRARVIIEGRQKSCGCNAQEDKRLTAIRKAEALVGHRFGRLVVIGPAEIRTGPKQGSVFVGVRCDCGKEKFVDVSSMRFGSSRSCGCVVAETLNSHRLEKDRRVGALRCHFYNYKYQADRRGIPFTLTMDEFEKLVAAKCSYCSAEPAMDKGRVHPDFAPYKWSGIDRVDNDLGYTPENSVSCCRDCNIGKGAKSAVEFEKWVMAVAVNIMSRESFAESDDDSLGVN